MQQNCVLLTLPHPLSIALSIITHPSFILSFSSSPPPFQPPPPSLLTAFLCRSSSSAYFHFFRPLTLYLISFPSLLCVCAWLQGVTVHSVKFKRTRTSVFLHLQIQQKALHYHDIIPRNQWQQLIYLTTLLSIFFSGNFPFLILLYLFDSFSYYSYSEGEAVIF